MPSVQGISGLVSGIDWEETIKQLIALESRPISLLETKKSNYETELSMWQQVNTNLESLQSTVQNYSDESKLLAKTATSSDSDIAAVSATGTATRGTHIISSVTSLARSNNYVAGTGYTSPNNSFGQAAGSFVINFANHPDGAKDITLTYGTDYSSSTSLDLFADIINNHEDNDGLVNASVINDGSANPYKLVLTAAESGTDYQISSIADTSTGLAMAEGLTAQNCVFNIDSINITKSSNRVDDVVDGMTFTLLDDTLASPITITVENDTSTVKTNVNSILNAYNSLKDTMTNVASYDSDNEIMGPLFGDSNLSAIRAKLDSILSSQIPGILSSYQYQSLASIGIKTDTKGRLTIDDTKFDDVMDENFEAIADVFCQKVTSNNSNIIFEKFTNNKTQPGTHSVVINYNGSGTITSATINGNAATILGSLIMGKEGKDEEGLLLNFVWPGSGSQSTATIRVSDGINAQLDKEIEDMTNEDLQKSEVYWAKEAINSSIDNIDEQIAAMEKRLTQKEDAMRREFNQLEAELSKMRQQASYLESNLPAS